MPEATLVIRGGTVVGPEGLQRLDVAVAAAAVVGLAESIDPPRGAVVLDAGGCLVGPGLVDLHTHLRQPGREEAETIETGARAAALGGYTAVVAMPNTEPAIDSAGVASEVLALGAGCAAEVAVAGAITVGPGRPRARPARRAGRAGRDALHRRRCRRAGRRAHAARPRLRQGPRRHAGPALRGRLPGRRRRHARGVLVEPARHPGHARRRRGGHGRPRHHAGPADRRAGPLPPPLDRRLGGPRAPGQGGGAPGDGRGGTAPHAPHRCRRGRVRPRLQGEPAAAHRRRRARRRGRPVRRHHRCRGDRPRPPRPRGEGRALRSGAPGHARAADRTAHRVVGAGTAPGPRAPVRADELAAGRHRQADGHRTPASAATARRAARSRWARRRTCASSTLERPPWWTRAVWPAGAATRRTPAARSRVRCATPCCGARPS